MKKAEYANNEISLFEILKKLKMGILFLVSRWWLVSIAAIVGGCAGIAYSIYKPKTYQAELSFLVEEGRSGGSGLASLAGQFGFDLGGLSGGNSVISGDNVMVFLKSNSLVREVLLTPFDSTRSLADQYAHVSGLQKKWKNIKVEENIFFPVRSQLYSRTQDSLLQIMVSLIKKNCLIVEKPDKKASFVKVIVEMKDELLAKYFCERLVKIATERYISTKTKRQITNVNRLQYRADSIANLLNQKTFATAIAQEQLLDVNPAFKSATVTAEVTGRDKIMLATIYGEVVKHLEMSKVMLSQETPSIQVIDEIVLPLKVNKIEKLSASLAGALFSIMIVCSLLILKFFFKQRPV